MVSCRCFAPLQILYHRHASDKIVEKLQYVFMIERTKSFIKSAFPVSVQIYHRLRSVRRAFHLRPPDMEGIFSDIYRNNSWTDPESVSGRGSTLGRTAVIRRELPTLLSNVGARSLLDAPCGDFNWMQHVALAGIQYIGADVVPELIARNRDRERETGREFAVLNITRDQLPKVDVILCRDCFIHFSFKDVHAAIANFKRSNSIFLLATTHINVHENMDIQTGGWRSVNLQLPPFNFPQPQWLIMEDPELGKCLGMWKLEELMAYGNSAGVQESASVRLRRGVGKGNDPDQV
jgi:SAM-dependent methyltransferase